MMAGNFQRSISDFAKQKAESLSSVDHSKKGTVDAAICDLVGFINASDNFFTTSSCSGRIAVIAEGEEKKKGCKWIFMSHEEASALDLIKSLTELADPGNATLKYESFVLHVQCRSLEDAQAMLQVALQAGFRNSGLVIGKKKRIMLGVRSTHSMEVPLTFDGNLMVSEEYITKIVQLCNEKLKENFNRIDRFFDGIKTAFPSK